MTEPSPPAASRGGGPAGLLRWPARIPLKLAAEPGPEPTRPEPGGDPLGGESVEPGAPVPAEENVAAAAEDAVPARRGISVPEADSVSTAKAPEQARPLGRPGPPALAGAAIAGLLLVVAPLALSALQRPETLATVPVTAGVGLRADGPGSGKGGGAGQEDSAGSAATDTLGGAAGGDQPGPGYVPDAITQEGSGESGDGGQEQGQSYGDGAGGGQNGDAAVSGSDGALAAGAPESSAGPDSDGQEGEGGGDSSAGGSTAESDGENAGDGNSGDGDSGDGNSDSENAGDGNSDGGDMAPMMANASAEEEDQSAPGAGPSPSATSSAPAFTALAGPGCPADTGASYGTAGRDDAAGWATRDGGYGLDGCEGTYDAIPVSGTAEHGDGKYAYWSFTPGFTDAECDIFVYVPEDGSPRWVTDREAMYQIFPGPDPSGSAAAVFGVQQAASKGGWVKVTGFVSPAEQFTVQLTNIGENAVADQAGRTSHVAASAVRTSCS